MVAKRTIISRGLPAFYSILEEIFQRENPRIILHVSRSLSSCKQRFIVWKRPGMGWGEGGKCLFWHVSLGNEIKNVIVSATYLKQMPKEHLKYSTHCIPDMIAERKPAMHSLMNVLQFSLCWRPNKPQPLVLINHQLIESLKYISALIIHIASH